MLTLKKPLRAQADTRKHSLYCALATAITWLLWPVIGCRHRHTTLPYNNRQTCLDCGATRIYWLDFDFEHADAGIVIGKWKKHTHPTQNAHHIVAKTLIAKAIRPQARCATFDRVWDTANQVADRYPETAVRG